MEVDQLYPTNVHSGHSSKDSPPAITSDYEEEINDERAGLRWW